MTKQEMKEVDQKVGEYQRGLAGKYVAITMWILRLYALGLLITLAYSS